MKNRLTLLFALLALFSVNALASSDEEQILTIIAAIETGWEKADGTPFKAHFKDFDGARYFESGGQNVGLTDLIEHHVEPEGHAISLDLAFNDPQIHVQGDFAWALFDTVVKGTVHKSGRKLDSRGHETVILQKVDGEWKVLHTHSSSRPVKK